MRGPLPFAQRKGTRSEANAGDAQGGRGAALPPPNYVRNKEEMSEGQRGHTPPSNITPIVHFANRVATDDISTRNSANPQPVAR